MPVSSARLSGALALGGLLSAGALLLGPSAMAATPVASATPASKSTESPASAPWSGAAPATVVLFNLRLAPRPPAVRRVAVAPVLAPTLRTAGGPTLAAVVSPAPAAIAQRAAVAPPPAPVTPRPVASSATTATQVASATPTPSGYGCAAALAYLQVHAAPGFSLNCGGSAMGHEAMTCVNYAGVCPGGKEIVINDPCPAAYMNEASNSWRLIGESDAPIDPYGSC